MGDGTKENPFTSADVIRRISERGTTEGLDLSGKVFEEGIDLHELDLTEAVLNRAILNKAVLRGAGLDKCHLEGAHLRRANLNAAHLRGAHLKGADLWRAHFEEAELGGAHLEEANLIHAHLEGADLANAHLEGADLGDAHLEEASLRSAHLEGAELGGAHLEGADLSFANFERADLAYAHLEGANLWFASLEGIELGMASIDNDTNLRDARWGNYILRDETIRELGFAINTYRRLKQWHTNAGMYDIAGKFFYREMEASRKMQSWKKPHLKLWYWAMRMLCGYGEKPERVVISAAVIVFGLAAAYCLWGSFSSSSFADTLYYSVASFTALGYGQWAPQPTGWAKGVGAAEAVLGVSMMALFLVTFTRKMIR